MMRTEIPRFVLQQRKLRNLPVMLGLENRTFLSTTPIKVIDIGPTRAIKSLDAVHWPARGDNGPVKFVLDYSAKPYVTSHHAVWGNVTITAADAKHEPTLQLQGIDYPSLYANGTLNISNIKTVGGEKAILLGSSVTGNINCQNITMTDGGAIWRGQGANNVYFKNNAVLGKPHNNVYANFTNRVVKCVIDHSGTNIPIPQGGHMVNGNPVGETAIRIMNVDDLMLIGIKTAPWFYAPGKEWKQDVQLRPSSKHIQVINCTFYQPDVGDMTWRQPAQPINEVDFINCTFTKAPNVTKGVKLIKIQNCTIAGKKVSKTM